MRSSWFARAMYALMLFLAACRGDSDDKSAPSPTTESNPPPPQAPIGADERPLVTNNRTDLVLSGAISAHIKGAGGRCGRFSGEPTAGANIVVDAKTAGFRWRLYVQEPVRGDPATVEVLLNVLDGEIASYRWISGANEADGTVEISLAGPPTTLDVTLRNQVHRGGDGGPSPASVHVKGTIECASPGAQ